MPPMFPALSERCPLRLASFTFLLLAGCNAGNPPTTATMILRRVIEHETNP